MRRAMMLAWLVVCTLLIVLPAATKAQAEGRRQQKDAALGDIRQAPRPSALGHRGSHVWQLQQALIALQYLSGEADGHYDQATTQAVMAFQREYGLQAHGRADAESLQLLFTRGGLLLPGETQRPYWYGGGSAIVPWGAQFQVLDIRSGIQFDCVRIQGQSHLDAEPITPYDTHSMRSAYGGEWQWGRRPILLRYQGQVIAASMMGMPHGHEVIPHNGMVGHFCIHFFESRGDGSQRVDKDHLACAVEASFAHWPQ